MTTNTTSILKSIADDMRLSVVRKLAQDNCEVASCDIVSSCGAFLELSQPTMSHHFNKLVQSGVVLERKEGTEKIYRLNTSLLQSIGIDPAKL